MNLFIHVHASLVLNHIYVGSDFLNLTYDSFHIEYIKGFLNKKPHKINLKELRSPNYGGRAQNDQLCSPFEQK